MSHHSGVALFHLFIFLRIDIQDLFSFAARARYEVKLYVRKGWLSHCCSRYRSSWFHTRLGKKYAMTGTPSGSYISSTAATPLPLKRSTVYRIVRLVENDYRLFELFRKRFDLLDGKPMLMVVSLFWGDCIPEMSLRIDEGQIVESGSP